MPQKFIKSLISKWLENKNTTLAAAIAFYTLFSFSPILVISVSLISLFVGEDTARQEIISLVQNNISPQAASIVETIFGTTTTKDFYASLISFPILLYASAIVFAELRHAFNQILGFEELTTQKEKIIDFIRGKLKAIFLVFCTGFLFLFTLFTDIVINLLDKPLEDLLSIRLSTIYFLNDLISFVLITLIFIGLFRFLPTKNLCFVSLISGSLVSSLLFMLGKNLLALYLSSAMITSFYGKAGSLVVVILWVYYSVQMLLLGAEVSNYLEERIHKRLTNNL